MDQIKKISRDEIDEIATKHGFNSKLMLKDHHLVLILYLIKGVEGIYFKGGTAINKVILNHARLSEDIDFTLIKDISIVKDEIRDILEKSSFFEKITKDKDVRGFTRLVVHYKNFSNEDDVIFVDLNQRAKLLLKPESHEIPHFYDGFISKFSFPMLAKEELIAEKVMATIGRNMPRDHYDLYGIIRAGIPINLELVKKKCREAGIEFSIIRMFNQAKKLKNRWDSDMIPLIREEVTFKEVISTLAKYFKLKEEKEKLR